MQELDNMKKIDLKKSIDFLKTKGIDATKKSKIKNLADELDITPLELYDYLKAL